MLSRMRCDTDSQQSADMRFCRSLAARVGSCWMCSLLTPIRCTYYHLNTPLPNTCHHLSAVQRKTLVAMQAEISRQQQKRTYIVAVQ